MPLIVHKQVRHLLVNSLNLHNQVRKDFWGGIQDSGFASINNRAPFPWLGMSTNEAVIRNLSLTLESIVESAVRAIAAEQKSLDSVATVDLDNRTDFGYLLAEHGGVNTTCCAWISTSSKVEAQLHKITEQATWLKKVTPSTGSYPNLLHFEWFGSWGPRFQSALQELSCL